MRKLANEDKPQVVTACLTIDCRIKITSLNEYDFVINTFAFQLFDIKCFLQELELTNGCFGASDISI